MTDMITSWIRFKIVSDQKDDKALHSFIYTRLYTVPAAARICDSLTLVALGHEQLWQPPFANRIPSDLGMWWPLTTTNYGRLQRAAMQVIGNFTWHILHWQTCIAQCMIIVITTAFCIKYTEEEYMINNEITYYVIMIHYLTSVPLIIYSLNWDILLTLPFPHLVIT